MSVNTFTPGPTPNTVRAADGRVLIAPKGWLLLPPGGAALTRRVKAAGDHWIVQEKKGRKVFSKGVWAPAATVERVRAELVAERSTEGYARRKAADARRRDQAQAEYVEDFHGTVVAILAFHPNHAELADRLARAVTAHATPVGSGTVARTRRIPVERRAEAAVIAWVRHQTTGYDGMVIPRVKGKRREVRRMLARRSQELLARYRRGEPVPEGCPLFRCSRSTTASGQASSCLSMTAWPIPKGLFTANTVFSLTVRTSTLSSFRSVVILNLAGWSWGASPSSAKAMPLMTRRTARGMRLALMLRLRPGPSL
jgi:hypothetical protein